MRRYEKVLLGSLGLWIVFVLFFASRVYAYSGTSNVTDASVNDARVDPSAAVTWTVGPILNGTENPIQNGWALDFDGDNDYVNCGSDASLDDLTEFTWEAWVYANNSGEAWARIFLKSPHLSYIHTNGQLGITLTTSGNDAIYYSAPGGWPFNTWVHLTITFNNATDRTPHVYFNGTEQTPGTIQAATGSLNTNAANNLYIAGDAAANSLQAQIDEVRIYNRTIGTGEITYSYEHKVPLNQTGLVLWHDYDWNTLDQTPNGNDGTKNGGPVYVRGIRGKAGMTFDGTGDFVNVLDDASLKLGTSDFTLSAWITRESSISSSEFIIAKGGGGANDSYELYITSIGIFTCRIDGTSITSSTGHADGLRHLIEIVADRDGNGIAYVDGQISGTPVDLSGITCNLNENIDLTIGKRGIGNYFNGSIDEVRIYTRSLSPTEAWEHYQGIYSNETGLVLYLDFDGQVQDHSGEGNNGAVNGDPEYSDGWASCPVSTSYNGTGGTTVELVNCTTGMTSIPDTAPSTHGNYTATVSVPAASANATYVGFIADLYNIDVRTVYDEIESGLYTLLVANGSSVIDGHPLTNGDSLTIDGVTFTYNSYTGDLEGSVRKNTPQTVTFDTVDSLSEATYGITNGNISTPAIVTWTTGSLDLIKPFFQTGDITGGILGVATQSMGALIFYSVFMLGLSVALYQYIGPLPTILAWMMGWGVFGGVVHGNARLLAWGLMSLGGGLLLVKIWYGRREG